MLAAGIIIIVFFANIALKQKGFYEKKDYSMMIEYVESIISGAGASANSINTIDLSKFGLSFVCDKKGYSEYSIKGTGFNKKSSEVMFAPSSIEGEAVIWTSEWKFPFKALNVMYFTDTSTRYFFVYNKIDSIASKMINDIPADINSNWISADEFKEIDISDAKKARLVFFNMTPIMPKGNENKDISAIKITKDSVEFYSLNNNKFISEGSTKYTDNSMLYGAVFSEGIEDYRCNMAKAFKRLGFVADINSKREEKLIEYYKDNPCAVLYKSFLRMNVLSDAALSCSRFVNDGCIESLKLFSNKIAEKNNYLISQKCVSVY